MSGLTEVLAKKCEHMTARETALADA